MYIQQKYIDLFDNIDYVENFVKEMFESGHKALPDFFTPETKTAMESLLANRSYGNKKSQQLEGTLAEKFAHSDELMKILNVIQATRCRLEGSDFQPLTIGQQRVGFPYKNAKDGTKTEPTNFHYDGAYINLLIPFVLPPEETNEGHLIMYPNLRRHIRNKTLCGICSSILIRSALARKLFPGTTLRYKVGSCYFFFGDVSLHGVPPIKQGERLVMTINNHW